jgi:aspartate carbamoyltransferase catalytic subunit
VLQNAIALKAEHKAGKLNDSFKNKVLGMLFEKSSTRTRVSFEAGMVQMGGNAIFLAPKDTQLGRGEPIEDALAALQGIYASDTVYSGSVASACVDISYDFAPTFALRIEKRIKDAWRANKLQLATINFDNVEPWFAE